MNICDSSGATLTPTASPLVRDGKGPRRPVEQAAELEDIPGHLRRQQRRAVITQ